MRHFLSALVATLGAAALIFAGVPTASADTGHVWPINGRVVRGFDPPQNTYGAGHRGIDIGAPVGTPVVAAADGVVTFAGTVAGVSMITVTHGDVRTTYQPVAPTVSAGQSVTAGQVIGKLQDGHGTTTSLHFGVLQGTTYLDPVTWLGGDPNQPVRLLPDGSVVPAAPRAAPAQSNTSQSSTVVRWPIVGTITALYGWRTDPFDNKTTEFHHGLDIAVACGTPASTPWPGTVVKTAYDKTLGNYVLVANTNGITTTYAHLTAITVKTGAVLNGGQQVGLVGQTGAATGCHLHFGTSRNGADFDPMTVLPPRS